MAPGSTHAMVRRVLLFSNAYRPYIGGSEIAVEQIARRIPGVLFDIITPRYRNDLPACETSGNVTIHRVGSRFWFLSFIVPKVFLPFRLAWYAWGLMRVHSYELFHAYQASQAAGALWIISRLYSRIPVVLTIQEGKDLDQQPMLVQWFRKFLIRQFSVITVISSFLEHYVRRVHPTAHIIRIPNGVDVDLFSRVIPVSTVKNIRSDLGISDDQKIIISISRLVPKNGLHDLISAVSLLKDRRYAVVIVGDGPELERLKSMAANLGVHDRVRFVCGIPHERVPEYLAIADVFVRPSLSEGLGNAFLEAMAAGVPVIGTPVGGIPDFLIDRMTGLLCELGNPDHIAQCIVTVLENSVLRRSMIDRARAEIIGTRFNWDTIAGQMRTVYNHVC